MKDFLIVLRFELMNFMKNKTFIISTAIICLLISIGLSVPTIKNTFLIHPMKKLQMNLGKSKILTMALLMRLIA